jgi:hypothetical protein
VRRYGNRVRTRADRKAATIQLHVLGQRRLTLEELIAGGLTPAEAAEMLKGSTAA